MGPAGRLYPHPCAAARPPAAGGGRPAQTTAALQAVYCILCSRRRLLPVANAAGKRSARSPRRRSRASNGGIQLRGKREIRNLPRVSQKFNLAFPPHVGGFYFLLFECRKTISFATPGEGRAGEAKRNLTCSSPRIPATPRHPIQHHYKKMAGLPIWG